MSGVQQQILQEALARMEPGDLEKLEAVPCATCPNRTYDVFDLLALMQTGRCSVCLEQAENEQ